MKHKASIPRPMWAILWFFAALGPWGACGEKNAFDVNVNPEIQVESKSELLPPGQTIIIGNVDVGQKVVGAVLKFTNRGDADLKITALTLSASPEGTLWLETPDGSELPSADAPWVIAATGAGAQERLLNVVFERKAAEQTVSGQLAISSNSTVAQTHEVVYPIEVVDLAPSLLLQPELLDFGNVVKGESKILEITIRNVGTDPLVIDALTLDAPSAYHLKLGPTSATGSDAGATELALGSPIVVLPGQIHGDKIEVVFSPQTANPMPGELRVASNDPEFPDGMAVPFRGNMTGACFTLSPASVNFGGFPVNQSKSVDVTIHSCGTAPLVINAIDVMADVPFSSEFSLDLSPIDGVAEGTTSLSTDAPPLILEVGETATFKARYEPVDLSLVGEDEPVADLGKVRFNTNTFVPERELHLQGHGLELTCPFAKIQVEEGDEVVPQTVLHLHGDASYAAFGEIDGYAWTGVVAYDWQEGGEAPIDLEAAYFFPSADVANPTIEVNAAGVYTFTLDVVDEYGKLSCVPDTLKVIVRPDEALHVELLWDTPGDLNPLDDEGSDLDLHFLHPLAIEKASKDYDGDGENDGWFMNLWDCFWYTMDNGCSWDGAGTDDDPTLDRDDTNGQGPENLNLKEPVDGHTYRVGVHYWSDEGFGPSNATVVVYFKGEAVYQATLEGLMPGQLWDVCTVTWSGDSGLVTPNLGENGPYKVFDDYPIPPAIPTD